jgi:hypothetical protein
MSFLEHTFRDKLSCSINLRDEVMFISIMLCPHKVMVDELAVR